jgi:hypothetical protein
MRGPVRHELIWNEEGNLSPTERFTLANVSESFDLQNYDIIVNIKEFGYRNTGVYIYNDGGIHSLSSFPDDYGSLPEWVEVRKEDCGFSYFKDYLIEHNSYIPFQTDKWEVVNTFVNSYTHTPFKYAYKDIEIITGLSRKSDGAMATISTAIRISAPWLGGPTANVKQNVSGSKSQTEYYEKFEYENGELLNINYAIIGDNYYQKELMEPLRSHVLEVSIPEYIIEKAETMVHSMLTKRFQEPTTVYFEAVGKCEFEAETSDFPTLWNGEETLGVITVIPLDPYEN